VKERDRRARLRYFEFPQLQIVMCLNAKNIMRLTLLSVQNFLLTVVNLFISVYSFQLDFRLLNIRFSATCPVALRNGNLVFSQEEAYSISNKA
jgi:hypothetical protein